MDTGLPELEKQILTTIKEGLLARSINADQAISIAQSTLAKMKEEMNQYQLFQAADELAKDFPALTGMAAEAEDHYEDLIRDSVAHHASDLISKGNIPEADALLDMAINKTREIQINE